MLGKLALPEIRELIEATMTTLFARSSTAGTPPTWPSWSTPCPASEQVHVLRLIKPRLAAETFAYLDLDTQQEVLESPVGGRVEVHLERDGAGRPDGAPGRAPARAGRAVDRTCSIPSKKSSPAPCSTTARTASAG